MDRCRRLAVTTRPPFEERAKAATTRSSSPASRTSIGLTSTPTDAATDWMTANSPTPEVPQGREGPPLASRAARSTSGAPAIFRSNRTRPAKAGDVTSWLCQALDEAGTNRIGNGGEHNRYGSCRSQQRRHAYRAGRQDDVWGKGNNFRRIPTQGIEAAGSRAVIDLHVAANGPAPGSGALGRMPCFAPADPHRRRRRRARRCAASARPAARERQAATARAPPPRRREPRSNRAASYRLHAQDQAS